MESKAGAAVQILHLDDLPEAEQKTHIDYLKDGQASKQGISGLNARLGGHAVMQIHCWRIRSRCRTAEPSVAYGGSSARRRLIPGTTRPSISLKDDRSTCQGEPSPGPLGAVQRMLSRTNKRSVGTGSVSGPGIRPDNAVIMCYWKGITANMHAPPGHRFLNIRISPSRS
ncbi:hypothetical protein BR93DRAFT_935135 [Coniochaeta sp. PMI_546]|nr:hypothetical protein BR93DRAFT_935135 [Coniochaeta sp. PMI_546]